MTFRERFVSLLVAATLAFPAFAQEEEPAAPAPQTATTAEDPAEAPSEPTAPGVDQEVDTITVESLETELAGLQEQLEAAAAAATPDAAAELGVSEEGLQQRAIALQDLENVLQRRITSLKRLEELRQSLADLENEAGVFEQNGLERKPPYGVAFLDQLRDQLIVAEAESETETMARDSLEASVAQAQARLAEAEERRRAARDAVEAAPDDAGRPALEWRLRIAQLEQRIAENELALAQAQTEAAQLSQAIAEQRTALLEKQIKYVADNIVFTPQQLQEQLADLQTRREGLDDSLRELRRAETANQARLEQARENLQQARGEEAIREATEAVAAREAAVAATTRGVELLQQRIDNIGQLRNLWELRFALTRDPTEADLAQWERDTAALLEENSRRREEVERRLQTLRTTKLDVDQRLASSETPEALRDELEARSEALEDQEAYSTEYLASLIALERLAERVGAEVTTERTLNTWRDYVNRFWLIGQETWERELFVIDDRSFRIGALIWAGVVASLVLLALFAARWVLRRTLFRHMKKHAGDTEGLLDDALLAVVNSTSKLFIIGVALYVGLRTLPLSERAHDWLYSAAVVALFIQMGFWASSGLNTFLEKTRRRRAAHDPSSVSAFGVMAFFGRILIWVLLLLSALTAMEIPITPMIAGLGVGGIAVAFALQNILGDIFCSFAILLDKPFVVGDFIVVGDLSGNVENIGIKTTRLRSLGGEQLVFSNQDLVSSRIRNYKRMYERRIVFTFGVVYETPMEKLEKIPGMVREIVEGIERTRFDRAHFKDYGDFSLNFEVVYYVLLPDYNVYMDIQQEINLKLFKVFQEHEINFAYPTQELIVRRNNGLAGPLGATTQLATGQSE